MMEEGSTMYTCDLLYRMSLLSKQLLIIFFFNTSSHPTYSEPGLGSDYQVVITGLSWQITGYEVSEVSNQQGFTKPPLGPGPPAD